MARPCSLRPGRFSASRPDEWRKILCGAAHFGSKQFKVQGALGGVDYKVAAAARELP
jgi:hypothetical protein